MENQPLDIRTATSGHTRRVLVAVHGGAGDLARSSPRRTQAGLDAVAESLSVARRVLTGGGAALDAVLAAVSVLEDAEALNAGRGAALTASGEVELDAAVCDGAGRRVGAVAAVRTVRHPVEAARAVLEHGAHVLLVGDAAARFAHGHGVERADPGWFVTEHQRAALGHHPYGDGTVGAVALDAAGHVAAATSTGGMSGQLSGRVGDTPILGAGTWADDSTAAVSATGAGEAFIRAVFAHHVHMRVLDGWALADACDDGLREVARLGGEGGCVSLTAPGELAMPFTSPAMFRGWADGGGGPYVAVEPGTCGPR